MRFYMETEVLMGVVLITTKTGKGSKLSVEYNTQVGFDEALVLPDYQCLCCKVEQNQEGFSRVFWSKDYRSNC